MYSTQEMRDYIRDDRADNPASRHQEQWYSNEEFVEKTAEHVAQNGSEFENMLLQRELNNKAQFSFLQKDSPYRAYYDHRVAEISKRLLMESTVQPTVEIVEEVPQQPPTIIQEEVKESVKEQAQFRQHIFQELKEPPPSKFIAKMPLKLSEGQIAIIQHTARYGARNGKNFLIALSQREKNNPQFQFLKISSDNNKYFTSLVENYTNLFTLSHKEVDYLNQCSSDKNLILNKCQSIYEYHKMKKEQSKDKKEETENKKQNYIDWNDYQLVETIMFDDQLDIKNDLTTKNAKIMSSISKMIEQRIIYEPKKKQVLQQCHACKASILASQMNKHLKSCIGQKKKNQIQHHHQAVDIKKNFQNFASNRVDIFGAAENEIIRNDQNETQKIIWDGQAPNITRHTATVVMLNNEKKRKEGENK